MNQPIIIGAGIAGLSAANILVDNGVYPIIIEANNIGQTKVCGEFFSNESISFLKRYNIPFLSIQKANFNNGKNKFSFFLPSICASTSRTNAEILLSQRAENHGARLLTNTIIDKIIPANFQNGLHQILLSNGEILETNKLIVSTSKLFTKDTSANYLGIKAHFKNVDIANELNMYLTKNAYMGVTYIDKQTVNVCCLAKKSEIERFDSIDEFMNYFFEQNDELKIAFKNAKKITSNWLTAQIDGFGKKFVPNWQNSYFIGDAIATIHPASGNGLAMSITSGVMAAKHILTNSQTDFKVLWKARYSSRLEYAHWLHSILISQKKSTIGFNLVKVFPVTAKLFYKFTRDY